MNWATRTKNKVHKITPIVSSILSMWYCNNHHTVARIVGCSEQHVRRIRLQHKSSAHVFLEPETIKLMRQERRRIGKT